MLLDNTPKTSMLKITTDMLTLISLDEFKGARSVIGLLAPERLLKLRRVATIESVGSSTRIRIEGVKLSDREVEACSQRD